MTGKVDCGSSQQCKLFRKQFKMYKTNPQNRQPYSDAESACSSSEGGSTLTKSLEPAFIPHMAIVSSGGHTKLWVWSSPSTFNSIECSRYALKTMNRHSAKGSEVGGEGNKNQFGSTSKFLQAAIKTFRTLFLPRNLKWVGVSSCGPMITTSKRASSSFAARAAFFVILSRTACDPVG